MSLYTLNQSSVYSGPTSYVGNARNCLVYGGSGSGWGMGKYMYAFVDVDTVTVKLKYSADKVNWSVVTIYTSSGGPSSVSIVVDSSSNVFVVFKDYNSGFTQKIVKYNGSSTIYGHTGSATDVSNTVANFPSAVIVDVLGIIHIFSVYLTDPGVSGIIDTTFDGTTWTDTFLIQETGTSFVNTQFGTIVACTGPNGSQVIGADPNKIHVGEFHIMFSKFYNGSTNLTSIQYWNTKEQLAWDMDTNAVATKDILMDLGGNIIFLWVTSTLLYYNYRLANYNFGTKLSTGYAGSTTDAFIFNIRSGNTYAFLFITVGTTSSSIYYLTKASLTASFSSSTLLQTVTRISSSTNPTILCPVPGTIDNLVRYITCDDYGIPI